MTVERQGIHPEGMFKRVVNGQHLYWHTLAVTGGQKHIYISGQVPRNEAGEVVGKGDMAAQIEQVGENIRICLEAAGATLADMVKTTTFTTDIDEYFKHAEVRMKYFGAGMPASSTIGIARLAHPDFMVEIDAYAII